jgi:SAM-dependent methyltransferase
VFVEKLRARFVSDPRIDVVHGDAAALPEGLSGFDSILCLNVLEHVKHDAAALRGFHAALRPGGALLLLVPAHRRLYGGYDRAAGHERRYDRPALRRLLDQEGFHIDTLRHVNPVAALGWLARVRLHRGDEWPSASFRTFDRLVPVLRPLERLRLPFGLSLWAVAKRPA